MKRSHPDLACLVVRLGGEAALAASARQHKAFLRSRKIKSAADLLVLLMMYALSGLSLRSTAALAAEAAMADLSDVGLMQRFRRAADWLEALCGQHLSQAAQAILQPVGAALPDQHIIIGDGSLITAPGGAPHRLHLTWSAQHQRIADAKLTRTTQGERLDLLQVVPGALYVGDRNYPNADALSAVTAAGADVLVRLTWNSLRLTHPDGRPLDWLALCDAAARDAAAGDAAAGGGLDLAVHVGKPRGGFAPLPLRLVIIPKPPEAAARAQRTARRNACRDQRAKLDGRTLACAGHLMLLTSLPAHTHTARQIAALYRVRWQIELAFKRMKSLLHMDRLPAKGEDLAKAWLHANLLAALLAHDTIAHSDGVPP